jgi:hypothetical protein
MHDAFSFKVYSKNLPIHQRIALKWMFHIVLCHSLYENNLQYKGLFINSIACFFGLLVAYI